MLSNWPMSTRRTGSAVFACGALAVVFVVFCVVVCGEERKARPNEELDQQISCRPGQALSDITWTEDNTHFKHYYITCDNYTDSCNETCEWTVACSVAHYGQGVYVRGVRAIYDNVNDNQRILFLCCNSSKSIAHQCQPKMKELTGSIAKKETNGRRRSFRQAWPTKAKDGHSVSLLVETCTVDGWSVPVCPILRMNSRSRVDHRLAGLAGLAGLTGLAGLALVVGQPQNEPCCCTTGEFEFCTAPCNECRADLGCNFDFCVEECTNSSTVKLLDTCLVDQSSASWRDAWNACYSLGGRLLELPDDTYNNAYAKLSSPLFPTSRYDNRWLGFMRNTSDTPPVRKWRHGTVEQDVQYNGTVGNMAASGQYPFCGRISKNSKSILWAEGSCSATVWPYFCQFLFHDVYGTTVGCDSSSASNAVSLPTHRQFSATPTETTTATTPSTAPTIETAVPYSTSPSTNLPSSTTSTTATTSAPQTAWTTGIDDTVSKAGTSPTDRFLSMVTQTSSPAETSSITTATGAPTPTPQQTTTSPTDETNPRATSTGTCPTRATRPVTSPTNQPYCWPNPCRNGGTCSATNGEVEQSAEFVCNCPQGFIGHHCEQPINWNYGPKLEEFCSVLKGAEVAGYCYLLQPAASATDVTQLCSRKGGQLETFSSPELLGVILTELNSPQTLPVAVGYQLTVDECDLSQPDPKTAEETLLDQLAQLPSDIFSGEGCAVLSQPNPGEYSIVGGDCDRAVQSACRLDKRPRGWTPALANYMLCPGIICLAEGTIECSQSGRECVCKPGWDGALCENKIDYCADQPCRFGTCINRQTSFECQCKSGFAGTRCQLPIAISTDPVEMYNHIAQTVGSVWIMISSGFTIVVHLALFDGSPEGTLKRHALHALFLEHTFIVLFHTPIFFTLSEHVCHSLSLAILYFRLSHTLLSVFQSWHIYTIMTGHSFGEWLMEDIGGRACFLLCGWGTPALLCLLISQVHHHQLATPFSCLLDWDGTVTRWLMVLFFTAGFTFVNLESAGMYEHRRARTSRQHGRWADPRQLRVAQAGRLGSFLVVALAPLSYWFTSLAVFTGHPALYTAALLCNVLLGGVIVRAYLTNNPYARAQARELWGTFKRGAFGVGQAPEEEEQAGPSNAAHSHSQ